MATYGDDGSIGWGWRRHTSSQHLLGHTGIFGVCREFFHSFKSTKLQPGQGCSQCQGTGGKLEDRGKCPPRTEQPPAPCPEHPTRALPMRTPHCTPLCVPKSLIPDTPTRCHSKHWHSTGTTSMAQAVPPGHPQPPHTQGGQGSQERVGFAREGACCQLGTVAVPGVRVKVRPRSGLHFLLANSSASPATVLAQPSPHSLCMWNLPLAPSAVTFLQKLSQHTFLCPWWGNHCLGTTGPLQISSNIWIFGIYGIFYSKAPPSSPSCARNALPMIL